MLNVVTINECIELLNKEFNYQPKQKEVEVYNALGEMLATDIYAGEDLPNFRRSTVDGYALISKDSFGASESMPSIFDIIGEIEIGKGTEIKITTGNCAYVPTGGMVPEGADAVIMIEYTEELTGQVMVSKPIGPLENIVLVGEDIKKDEQLFKKGHKLRPQDIGLLYGLGITKVTIYEPMKIGIISTGDEVVNPNQDTREGQIRDINTYVLSSMAKEDNCTANIYGIVKDEFENLRQKLSEALEQNDLVLISGGSSAGMKDLTCDVINSIGNPGVLVHGLQAKPGKPTIIGRVDNKAIFGLPGHPAAALMIYIKAVRKLINNIKGHNEVEYPISAYFGKNYSSIEGREEYVLVRLEKQDKRTVALPIYYKSALISPMSKTDGYIIIEPNKEGVYEGEKVEVWRL